jgi:hypothetical protein
MGVDTESKAYTAETRVTRLSLEGWPQELHVQTRGMVPQPRDARHPARH